MSLLADVTYEFCGDFIYVFSCGYLVYGAKVEKTSKAFIEGVEKIGEEKSFRLQEILYT